MVGGVKVGRTMPTAQLPGSVDKGQRAVEAGVGMAGSLARQPIRATLTKAN